MGNGVVPISCFMCLGQKPVRLDSRVVKIYSYIAPWVSVGPEACGMEKMSNEGTPFVGQHPRLLPAWQQLSPVVHEGRCCLRSGQQVLALQGSGRMCSLGAYIGCVCFNMPHHGHLAARHLAVWPTWKRERTSEAAHSRKLTWSPRSINP